MDEKIPQEDLLGEGAVKPPQGSILERIKLHLPSSFIQSVIIPGIIVLLVLLIGGGGTYLVAANVLHKDVEEESGISSISQSDIPEVPTIAFPTSTPIPTTPIPEPTSKPASTTPTPIIDPTANWTPYSYSTLYLDFSYPPGWYVNVANTSGAPYLYVQNFPGAIPSSPSSSQYAILIGRLPQVGITTISALTTQLALNAVNSNYINGVNMGQITVVASNQTTINGYLALQRTVTFSNFPSVQYSQVYVLDGVTNAVLFMPLFNASYGQSYFNALLTTIDFTN